MVDAKIVSINKIQNVRHSKGYVFQDASYASDHQTFYAGGRESFTRKNSKSSFWTVHSHRCPETTRDFARHPAAVWVSPNADRDEGSTREYSFGHYEHIVPNADPSESRVKESGTDGKSFPSPKANSRVLFDSFACKTIGSKEIYSIAGSIVRLWNEIAAERNCTRLSTISMELY